MLRINHFLFLSLSFFTSGFPTERPFSSYRLTNLLLSHLLSSEILERNQWERQDSAGREYVLVCTLASQPLFCICIYSRTRTVWASNYIYLYKVLPKRCHVVARWLGFSAWLRTMSWPHSVELNVAKATRSSFARDLVNRLRHSKDNNVLS